MGILDMFRNAPSQAAQQQQQQQQAVNQQNQQQQQTNGLPVEPANPTNKEEEVSGLAKFEQLWQPVPKKEGEQDTSFDPNKLFDLDPAKLQEGLKGFDATKGINQQDLQAVLSGGEEAGAALLRILNASNQATLAAAVQATGGMTSSAFARAMPSLDGKINTTVRSQQIGTKLTSESPLMKNEATRPMLTALATQFASKHPEATPDEIVAMVNDYMVTVSESMGMQRPGSAASQPVTKASEETDWSKYWGS